PPATGCCWESSGNAAEQRLSDEVRRRRNALPAASPHRFVSSARKSMSAANTRQTPYPDEPLGGGGPAGGRLGSESNGHAPQDAFKQVAAQVTELRDYATYYLGAKIDGIKLSMRKVALYAALGILGAIVATGML